MMTDTRQAPPEGKSIRLGISACLLGQRVRYDGGHKFDPFLVNDLGRLVEWVPVCPEVEMGLPVPREPMRLTGDPAHPRLIGESGTDFTERMRAWAQDRVRQLADVGLHGFVFKSGSPSSGLLHVKVFDERGLPSQTGIGLFAREVMAHFPLMPVEQEDRLNDLSLRSNFIERVYAYYRRYISTPIPTTVC